ncbi:MULTISPECIES: hypothetical protein [Burkholderia]|uniref:hypothetical protein n=1 Tax=Burkholderia TaxID=32008 RepID=UPI00210AE10A|nr:MULTISPECIES: hypothetical protein [Burkholderia]
MSALSAGTAFFRVAPFARFAGVAADVLADVLAGAFGARAGAFAAGFVALAAASFAVVAFFTCDPLFDEAPGVPAGQCGQVGPGRTRLSLYTAQLSLHRDAKGVSIFSWLPFHFDRHITYPCSLNNDALFDERQATDNVQSRHSHDGYRRSL